MFIGRLITLFSGKKLGTVGADPNAGLPYLLELIEAGKVIPILDRTFPLAETADAFRYFMDGHVKGKIVITM